MSYHCENTGCVTPGHPTHEKNSLATIGHSTCCKNNDLAMLCARDPQHRDVMYTQSWVTKFCPLLNLFWMAAKSQIVLRLIVGLYFCLGSNRRARGVNMTQSWITRKMVTTFNHDC